MIHSADNLWWSKHTGDYVLGLMSDSDRLVFERIMQVEPDVQAMVVQWREELQPMADALHPIEPPEHILPSLITNLPVPVASAAAKPASSSATADQKIKPDPEKTRQADKRANVLADGTAFMRMLDKKQRSTDRWRGYAGLATVACLLMGMAGWIGFQQNEAKDTEQHYDGISILEDASAQALWLVDSSANSNTLRVTALAPPELEEGKVFELWMAKPDDGGVVSMGVLPATNHASVKFKARRFDAGATGFSVSLEDMGGSSESVPVGPVLYRGILKPLAL